MEGAPPASQPVIAQTTAPAPANGNRHGSTALPPPSSSLHSVRKTPAKPWKKPAAPPIPPRVYRVDPRGFRQLVQKLTGATDLAPRRLQDEAPAPPELPPRPCATLPQPPQQPAALPVQAYDHGGASLSSYTSSTPEFALWFSAGEVAEPPRMATDVGYQSQNYAGGIPSPSLYSACLTWGNPASLDPGLDGLFGEEHSAVVSI